MDGAAPLSDVKICSMIIREQPYIIHSLADRKARYNTQADVVS